MKPMWTTAKRHPDFRGSMTEAFRDSSLKKVGMPGIAQINVSKSHEGVLRGIHWHLYQWDAWFVAVGQMQVVVHDRSTGQLSTKVLGMGDGVYIPPGFGHGFLSLKPVVLLYAVSKEFNVAEPDEQEYHAYSIGAKWLAGEQSVTMSERDRMAQPYVN